MLKGECCLGAERQLAGAWPVPKTMRPLTCVLILSNLFTLLSMWLLLRYCTSRSPIFPKRDALERVHAQLKIGRSNATAAADLEGTDIFPANPVESTALRTRGKKGVQDSAMALDGGNHSRQDAAMDILLGKSRRDQVDGKVVSERRNESAAFKFFGTASSRERVVNQRPVNIMMWKRHFMDAFWGAGHTNRMLSLANACSPSCRYFSSDDVDQFKDKPLDAVLIYAGHKDKGVQLWQQWMNLGNQKPKTELSAIWHTEADDDEVKARNDAKQHLRISYSFDPDIQTPKRVMV
jgi:hypothetical protein